MKLLSWLFPAGFVSFRRKKSEDKYPRILGDPGAVSGAGDKVITGGKKFDEQKVQTKNRSPWGQTLYGPVPNGRANTRS